MTTKLLAALTALAALLSLSSCRDAEAPAPQPVPKAEDRIGTVWDRGSYSTERFYIDVVLDPPPGSPEAAAETRRYPVDFPTYQLCPEGQTVYEAPPVITCYGRDDD